MMRSRDTQGHFKPFDVSALNGGVGGFFSLNSTGYETARFGRPNTGIMQPARKPRGNETEWSPYSNHDCPSSCSAADAEGSFGAGPRISDGRCLGEFCSIRDLIGGRSETMRVSGSCPKKSCPPTHPIQTCSTTRPVFSRWPRKAQEGELGDAYAVRAVERTQTGSGFLGLSFHQELQEIPELVPLHDRMDYKALLGQCAEKRP